MISHVYIKDLAQYVGQSVTLKGWLYNKRSSGKVKFLVLRDGTGYLQCIVLEKPQEQLVKRSRWTRTARMHTS